MDARKKASLEAGRRKLEEFKKRKAQQSQKAKKASEPKNNGETSQAGATQAPAGVPAEATDASA